MSGSKLEYRSLIFLISVLNKLTTVICQARFVIMLRVFACLRNASYIYLPLLGSLKFIGSQAFNFINKILSSYYSSLLLIYSCAAKERIHLQALSKTLSGDMTLSIIKSDSLTN